MKLVKTPVYQQLNDLLRQQVRSPAFKVGDRFLTERQIAAQFQVSRATANKALSNLVSEGVLEFRKGLGTFIQGGPLNVDLGLLVSFTSRAQAMGRTPQTRVLTFTRSRAADLSPDIKARLSLGPNDDALVLQRLRQVDSRPVILEHRIVVERLCPGLDARVARGSLYGFFTQQLRLILSGADQILRAVGASPEESILLSCKRGAPCLEVTAVAYLDDGAALWWERTLYLGDAYQFHNRLGKIPGQAHEGTAGLVLT